MPGISRKARTAATLLLMTLIMGCNGEMDRPRAEAASHPTPPAGPYQLLVQGGQLLDGTGAPPRPADLLIRDGRIAFVGEVDPGRVEVTEVVDARGLVVSPGFIDPHAHGDPLETPGFPNFLAMGVTTVLLGQDGGSPEVEELPAIMARLESDPPALNVAWLVGHNTIRGESGVGFGTPDNAGLSRMAGLVEAGMEAGAFGLSLGLEYNPGDRAEMQELVAIAEPVAARDGVVMSHMRNEDAEWVEDSLAELLEQGRRSGARVHASHLKVVLGDDPGQARRMVQAMAEARRDGAMATGDVYPYTASFTGLSILFPDWARPPNDYESVRRNRGDELAAHLRARVENRNGPEATLFGTGELTGRTLAEVADARGLPFEEILMELGPGGARAAYFVMDEEIMTTFVTDPWVAVASDGSPTMSHPRGYGAFARVLRRHVREEGHLALEEAVRKMTGLTASILGLDDPRSADPPRGLLQEGWAADLLLFDPAEVEDRADFQNPHTLAEGMRGVWVNGVRVWAEGAPVPGVRPGRVLRHGGGEAGREAPP